ncbi:NAD-dependent succinate-semialdehyde dehydrogenase [Hoeflea sp. G2-23]|uniref:NAD-dependent succinate-semialdehyde dehydrogenase n=1 Tax=Hoeflea algicola TaxID=2983763 RepID=A0ABT3ZD59_9HYPH|nr:NAD-dependent succinate-semialdehyde dehydrogenase [Hoeflea algicola]MCY0149663.1 NAD-dependent succinate-semialdehyde dehydrogenase [Hoeflea algicola]
MPIETPVYPDVNLMIAGEWRSARSGETLAVLDPATNEQIGTVAKASEVELEAAVVAAAEGFAAWSAVSAFDRSKIMRRAADLLRERCEHIAWLMTREQGKPLAEAKGETLAAADLIDWFAEEGRRAFGQMIPARSPGVLQMAVKQPIGPVAAFTPWNFPINQVVRKLSAALAAGCSIVIKAPEETPASPAELVRAFIDAGVPAGAVGLVFGDPAEISNYLIAHPVIRKVTFTGSTPVGKHLAALAGRHMKPVTMELGGHAPAIVLDDADIGKASATLAMSKFRNAGQVCVSPTRFMVQERVFGQFLDGFVEAAKALRVGNGLDPQTQMGPLANRRRVSALEGLIKDAVEHGAELRTGGRRIGNEGNFFEPTVLANVPVSARIMNEEPFGPVAIINPVSDLEEALSEANRLPFGLASYAFTGSTAAIAQLSARLEAGMLTINHLGLALPEVPFGGIKDSGYGNEGGTEAIQAFLTTKFVSLMQ